MTITFAVPGNSAGPFTSPRIKFLIHTTEGTSIEGAVAAYRANNSWPHDTVDFMFGHPYRIAHHLSYDVAGRSLRNLSGGVQTNTAGVIQVEVVGFATRPDQIDWRTFAIDYLGPRCRQLGIPIQSSVPWVAYPASFGMSAPQRLSGSAWMSYRGILGHQHCPENDHGDPGAIPIQLIIAAAQGQLPPPPPPPPSLEEDDDVYLLFHPAPSWWQIGPGKVAIQISGNAFDRMKKTSAGDLNGLSSFALNAEDCDAIIDALNGPPPEEPVIADPNS